MSSSPIVNRIRVIPRETDFLENNVGSRGEIYFDNDNDTLRLYNKETKGGFLLVNEKKLADALDGLSKQTASAQAIVSDNSPSNPSQGDLWWNSADGKLKIYYDDGQSAQWVDAN
jgi:hypothetical protein